MTFKKNQIVELYIDDLGTNGEGIGHIDGYALFVVGALPGERVRVGIMKCKKNYGFARLVEVLESPAEAGRIQPRCEVARQCGGCSLQHMTYEKQLAYKEKKVKDCLERIGGVCFESPVEEDCKSGSTAVENVPQFQNIIGMDEPWYYRNKVQLPVRMGKDGQIVTGFFAGRTHDVIPVDECFLENESFRPVVGTFISIMRDMGIAPYDEKNHTGIVRHIYIRSAHISGDVMACIVVNSDIDGFVEKYGEAIVREMSDKVSTILVNSNTERTNVVLGREMRAIYGDGNLIDNIGDMKYKISPHSFYQVNPVQTEKLYNTALEFAGIRGGEVVWDMYCGIGTISLFLADKVGASGKVIGVEIVEDAIKNAKENARLNGLKNTAFYCGAAEDVVGSREIIEREGEEVMHPDVVVVDPPRKGCDASLLATILKMAPARVVYVSCDPATLARDVKILCEGEGEVAYSVKKVRPVDMFPWSGHVESIALLERVSNRKADAKVHN
ncbi:23S rRNA (uracil(1939)-C(5))-methyltransferase RlmD [Eubacterium xylanophilum]|uniref:23S rRNA (uracil(1939)-C(5))-methyltransferase RlmD n=1 Tax=Eubacterium xylanophilum TaxID=39497 RepID=UPI0004B5CD60|nr:23S rRNA (uracil(1939)-C(5))-methyltransferase RlmD [Eubacterium xylanophilum]